MKILVTGATGQLGSTLLIHNPSDHEVIGLGRAQLELTDAKAITSAIEDLRPDWIINCAAYTAVDAAESDEELARQINGEAPLVMAKALSTHGGRLLQISTDFVFDGASTKPYVPNAPTNPLSVYGKTKLIGEKGAGPSSIIVRTGWVYAAGGKNFVRTMLRLMREGKEVRVVSDQTGTPTWANSLAKTVWGLVASAPPGIYHHRDGGFASWYDFAIAIAEEAYELGMLKQSPVVLPIASKDYPTPAQRPQYSVLDDSATRSLLQDRTMHWRKNLRAMLREEGSRELCWT